ncbi:MAG: hypothetical protein NTW19_18950 [Planctomycetota bacterium]|nr:hypothetical protein [Planctomycetota bacterium]
MPRPSRKHRATLLAAGAFLVAAIPLAGCETRVVRETNYGPGSAFNTPHHFDDDPPKRKNPNAPGPSFPNPFTVIGNAFGAVFGAIASPFKGLSKPDPVVTPSGSGSGSTANLNGEGVLQASDGHQYKVRFQDGKVISSEPRLDSTPSK